jgi:predicted kinase
VQQAATGDDPRVADSITLRLPDPCLVVLVGAAGAGKTTLAGRLFAADEVLSSDAFRELIAGDPADQRATAPAFAALHRHVRRRLSQRRFTVVDATSVSPRDRRPLVHAASEAGVPAVALVLDLPPAVVLARNAGRGARAVPEPAVQRHLRRLEASLRPPGLEAEGFALVLSVRDPADADRLAVVREATLPPGMASA